MAKKTQKDLKKHIHVRRGMNGLGLFTSVPIKKGEFVVEKKTI